MEKNHTQNNKKWRENNPEKVKAYSIVGEAVKTGKLINPRKCSRCNLRKLDIEAHQEDYSKPLDVIWLC